MSTLSVNPAELEAFRWSDPNVFIHPAEKISAFVEQLIENSRAPQHERRMYRRHLLSVPVLVRPVDRACRPLDVPFEVLTRDISTTGIGLLHVNPIACAFLALQISGREGDDLRILMRVVRCRPLASFYEIGGRFLLKFSR